MNRLLLSLVLGSVGLASAAADPIRERLDDAKADFAAVEKRYQDEVRAYFDRREEFARKEGPKKALDQVRVERQSFKDTGELPATAPATLKPLLATGRGRLVAAYKQAVKEYVLARKDEAAAAVEKELAAFQDGWTRPADAVAFGGRYYKLFTEAVDWPTARKRCNDMGGHLVVVTSEKENEFVIKLAAAAKVDACWLGFTDEKKEGDWMWVTGVRSGYTCWHREGGWKEPNNFGGNEHHAALFMKFGGRWCDVPGDPKAKADCAKMAFVCQWD